MQLRSVAGVPWQFAMGLAVVLLLAAALRIPAIERGLFHWDEAQYLFAVQPGVLELRDTLGIGDWPRPFSEQSPFDTEAVPYWAFSTKPGYDLIVLLYGTIAGLTPSSVAALSVLFGLGTVLILYGLARRVFDDRVALAAAVILAVSTYHVFYSASQIPAVMATFFLLLGIHFYFVAEDRASPRRLVLAGVTIAYAFGCHYNLLLFVLAIFGFQAFRVFSSRGRENVRNVLLLGSAFLATAVAFELFYRALIPFAYGHLSDARGAYLEQLRFTVGFFQWALASGIERFPSLMLDSEGLYIVALSIFGWGVSAKRAFQDPSIGILWALPALQGAAALYAGFNGSPVFSRMVVTMLPFCALWAAVGIVRLAQTAGALVKKPYASPAVVSVAVAAVLLIQVPRAWAVAHYRSGYPEAAAYVKANGGGQEVTLGLPVEQYYLRSYSGVLGLPTSLEALKTLRDQTGVRLLVLDYRVNVLEEWGQPLGAVLREWERRYRPETVIANAMAATPLIAAEIAMTRESLARTLEDPLTPTIRIYDLTDVLSAE
jgi:4-amino-4-deoxy-L-arabinose transferase-like glycosyltransferase